MLNHFYQLIARQGEVLPADANEYASAIVDKEYPVGGEATLQQGEILPELGGKKMDTSFLLVVLLWPVPLPPPKNIRFEVNVS